jgi:signal peptidase I
MKAVAVVRDTLLVAIALIVALGAVLAIYFGAGFLTITSRSMEPTFSAGDMVLTRMIPANQVKVRDVLVLPVPEKKVLRYSHRVVSLQRTNEGLQVTTKGDANPLPDAWKVEISSDKVTKVISVIRTAPIFSGPISRSMIYYGLFYGGAVLAFFGAWRLVRR